MVRIEAMFGDRARAYTFDGHDAELLIRSATSWNTCEQHLERAG